jgi:serine protease
MRQIRILLLKPAMAGVLGLILGSAVTAAPEWNPVRSHSVEIGPQASRLVIGFRATPGNSVTRTIRSHAKAHVMSMTQAQTSEADVSGLSLRAGVAVSRSRQLTPSMHVVFLQKTLYGADVDAVLQQLRADPSVEFADVDGRRYPHAVPDDPLFGPNPPPPATGQWYMQPPSTLTPTSDAAATDAVTAWNFSKGSSGTVIADVDSGIRFDHPDLLRAGLGGRLLPGYDFVSEDRDRKTGAPLGTFLIANDGDGADPDPSDPGDWVSLADMTNPVFPAAQCGDPNNNNGPVQSSWHGTRVMGVLGAITNNGVGIAGMTWNSYLLPVRALGKCGGFDSDIIPAILWAVGLPVTGVPDNPFPASIVNLSIGGTGSCANSGYASLVSTLATMGVLVVASAGNESGPVDVPGNCPGVLAVAGLRNVGTKVGFSNLGPEVVVGAPAGNCVNTNGGPCLRSIDTTVNEGATVPGANSYTDQINSNLGTSFSAPIVSGIAALMRAANANLTPPQLIARMKASATPYPQPVTTPPTPQCVIGSASNAECACTTTAPTTCGAGMVNALSAVRAALNPIAAVNIPTGFTSGSGTFDGGGSAAACGATIASYSWTGTPAITIVSSRTSPAVDVMVSGAGTLTLIVTDSLGNTDTAVVTFKASGATTLAPAVAGTAASACIADMTVTLAAPTVSAAYLPASVAANAASTFVVTITNSNGFVLTQSGITLSIPAGLTLGTQVPTTSCSGAGVSLTNTSSSVTLAGANIPVNDSCNISFSVISATAGTYTATVAPNDLMTGPAAGNTAPASASLTVTAAGASAASANSGGGGGGGGSMDWLDMMLITGVLLIVRGHAAKRNRP